MRKIALSLATAGLVTVAMPTPQSASAASKTNYKLETCSSGSFAGKGSNQIQNGTLFFGWCKSGSNMTTVTVKYRKETGSAVRMTFGYEWTDVNGDNSGGRHWDQSNVNNVAVRAGEIWGARFKRSGEKPPSSNLKCLRGMIKTYKSNGSLDRTYATRTAGPGCA